MKGESSSALIGSPSVVITNGDTHAPETWAEICVQRILYVGDHIPAPLRTQALAFREQMKAAIAKTIKDAIESDRTFRS